MSVTSSSSPDTEQKLSPAKRAFLPSHVRRLSVDTSLLDGKGAAEYRVDFDSLGPVRVPKDALWGASTQRTLLHFNIGENERMPATVIKSLGIVKKAAVLANMACGRIDGALGKVIEQAATEVAEGKLLDHFPLSVWQSGSGTPSNMNANEVIANRANQILGSPLGAKHPVHPNDHVNLGQSTNDAFPTAMHIACALAFRDDLDPELDRIIETLANLESKFGSVVKIGRTHMQDAVPLTVGQEFSAFKQMMIHAKQRIFAALAPLYRVAMGGTAVGTGLNTYKEFAESFAKEASKITDLPILPAENFFEALSSNNAIVNFSGTISAAASDVLKIGNDIRLLSSGPRCGIGELVIPSNEPGSSIMPGKINPTQCESLTMACLEIIGNHSAVLMANAHGHLQLNVFRPLTVYNIIRSLRLMTDGLRCFNVFCLQGLSINKANIDTYVNESLMLVTALTPYIGYDKAAEIALNAHETGRTLRESAVELKILSEADFDRLVRPEKMCAPFDSGGSPSLTAEQPQKGD